MWKAVYNWAKENFENPGFCTDSKAYQQFVFWGAAIFREIWTTFRPLLTAANETEYKHRELYT